MSLIKTSLALVFLFLTAGISAQENSVPQLSTSEDSLYYSIGITFSDLLRKTGLNEIDPALVVQGMVDGLKGNEKIDHQVASLYISSYMMSKQKAEAKENMAESKKFLAENKNKPGVNTAQSGLQYKILKKGSGPFPADTSKVTVNYTGYLLDGTVFDSSSRRSEPTVLEVDKVIYGFREALEMMQTGSKWKIWIPPSLGYGENVKNGSPIGPNMVLVFEIELVKIQ